MSEKRTVHPDSNPPKRRFRCPHCGGEGLRHAEPCPYDADVHNTRKLCRCCEKCRDECAREI